MDDDGREINYIYCIKLYKMKTTFTKQFMQENCGCYAEYEGKLESCSFMQTDLITIESIIESEIPLKDKFWFVIRKCASLDEQRQIAIEVAECVLLIYEERYQNNKAPRKVIEAAKKYIKGEISLDELIDSRSAAVAAAYAAAVAHAHAAAAFAADAAAFAADAAVAHAHAAAATYVAAAVAATDAAAALAADAAHAAATLAADAAYVTADVAAFAAASTAHADTYKERLLNILRSKITEPTTV